MSMRLPGHKYLGPGNKLDEGEPVDEDDLIARHHDEDYARAVNEEEIREADREAISSFAASGSAHGLIGAAGLGLKYGVESLTGVLYPRGMKRGGSSDSNGTSKKLNRGQEAYRARQQALHRAWIANGKQGTWTDWLKAHARDAADDSSISYGTEPGTSGTGVAREPASPEGSSGNTAEEAGIAPSVAVGRPERPFNFINYMQRANDMEVDAIEANRLAASGPSGSAGRSSSAGGSGGGLMMLNKSITPRDQIYKFRRHRVVFSYGYATTAIKNGTDNILTTPLALLPVDFLPFYITPSEFDQLPYGSKVVNVKCNVVPLGVRTAFEFGGTTTGHTTNEFVPIGMAIEGLNIKFPIKNVRIGSTGNNMIAGSVKDLDVDDMRNRMWSDPDSSAHLVPRHVMGYAGILSTPDSADNENFWSQTGCYNLDTCVNTFLLNTAVGQPIINYEYKPVDGAISTKAYDGINANRTDLVRGCVLPRSMKISPVSTTTAGQTVQNKNTILLRNGNEDFEDWVNFYNFGYFTKIEKFGFNPSDGMMGTNKPQPQIHVGIQAVPAMTPGSERVTFQNTSAYWSIDTEMEIAISPSSYRTLGVAHTGQHDTRMYAQQKYTYGRGLTMLGMDNELTGSILLASNSTTSFRVSEERNTPQPGSFSRLNR